MNGAPQPPQATESQPRVPAANSDVPDGAYTKGRRLPADQFVQVGRCASTGKEITICYNTFGSRSDPCLLMVNGLASTLLTWSDSLCELLAAAGFYVIRYDNRDVGLSTHLDELPTPFVARMALPAWLSWGEGRPPYTLEDMAQDGLGLLTALGIEQAHVLGTSMGGMIAQCVALRAPARVRSMTLVFTHSSGPHVKPQTTRMTLAFLEKPRSNSFEDVVDFKAHFLNHFVGEYAMDEAETRVVARRSLERAPEDKCGMMRQMWATKRAASREAGLAKLKDIPTLVLHGMVDTMIPFENGVALARLIPNSKLVAFPRMGHWLPPELFDAIVAEVQLVSSERK